MTKHKTGTREEWLAARRELLAAEKEHTRAGDELARRRRELPWVRLEKEYKLQTEHGPKTLRELFAGRSQLLVYHFMFGPHYQGGCPTCSSTGDSVDGVLVHLEACDATMIFVSRAPIEKLLAYRKRMGWRFPWASSYESDFNFDYGLSAADGTPRGPSEPLLEANELAVLKLLHEQPAIRQGMPSIVANNSSATGTSVDGYFSEGHGFSTFAREGDAVYHCYSSYARGTEFLMSYYGILDRAPKGRDEGDQPMSWMRRHDEYQR
ncbi:MAG TPA: DUF899 domain-containing protein [Polyangia bacterium]|nr:DUF899 domain-containing protein [Polyangia bacterium]